MYKNNNIPTRPESKPIFSEVHNHESGVQSTKQSRRQSTILSATEQFTIILACLADLQLQLCLTKL